MKKVGFICLVILGTFFASCHSSSDTWGDWSKDEQYPGEARVGAVSFTIGTTTYVGLGFNPGLKDNDKTLRDFSKFENGEWSTSVPDFPGLGRYGAVAFVVDNKAYVGTGYRGKYGPEGVEIYYNDFYVFDGETETWSEEPVTYLGLNAPNGEADTAIGRRNGIAFALNGKGYVGTGATDSRTLKDFYEYDPLTGSWAAITFKGDTRQGGVVFIIDNKAVVCLGAGYGTNDYKKDVHVFDPTTKEWTKKEPLVDQSGRGFDNQYDKIPRAFAIAFTSDLDVKPGGLPRGYIATGAGPYARTCWEYNLETDRWEEVSELPNAMPSRTYGVGFSYRGYGYMTTGGVNLSTAGEPDTWKFVPGMKEDSNNDY